MSDSPPDSSLRSEPTSASPEAHPPAPPDTTGERTLTYLSGPHTRAPENPFSTEVGGAGPTQSPHRQPTRQPGTPTQLRSGSDTEPTDAEGEGRLPEVPGYEVLRVLGRGGVGVVYQARQVRLNRVVALKMIRAGQHARPTDRARFRTEAEAVARLHHPHIVQVYEVGEADGVPYFSLEYVEGGTLAHRATNAEVSPRQAAEWVLTLARAVHHAHSKGVVHRDLKPGNVLLTADGTLKLTDFGLAKFLDHDEGHTQTGVIMGTPSFMAPEQAAGKGREAGPAADVYSLGAILYALLTGRPPFKGGTTVDTLRQILHDEPVSPSRLHHHLPRDLDTICVKCLQKEPAQRYASAGDLADDLKRFLDGEPIRARALGPWARTLKWARRRPAAAALALVSAASALGLLGLAGALWYNAELRASAVRSLDEANGRLRRAAGELDDVRGEVARQQGLVGQKQEEARRVERAGRRLARRIRYAADMQLGAADWETNHLGRLQDLLEKYRRPGRGEEDVRGFEWYYLWRLAHGERLTLEGPRGPVTSVAVSPDGKVIAAGSTDRTVVFWDTRTGKRLGSVEGLTMGVTAVSFSPDGKTLALGTLNGTVYLCDARTRTLQLPGLPAQPGAIQGVAFSPDGQTLLTAAVRGGVKLWDVATRKERGTLKGYKVKVLAVAFSPDGQTLATGGTDRAIKLWDPSTGTLRATLGGHDGAVTALAFAPGGKVLASGSADRTVRFWDVRAQASRGVALRGHEEDVSSAAFTADGRTLVTGSLDRTVRVWDVAGRRERAVLKGHTRGVRSLALHRAGAVLVTGGDDRVVKVWDLSRAGGRFTVLARPPGAVHSVALSPDGRTLACGRTQVLGGRLTGVVEVWDLAGGKEPRVWREHQGSVTSVAFSPDGKTLATAGVDRTVKLWDVGTGKVRLQVEGHTDPVGCVAYTPDGALLVSGAGPVVTVWDASTGKRRATLARRGGAVRCVAVTRDGRTLAAGYSSGEVVLWDVASGTQRGAPLRGHGKGVYAVAFAPGGQVLATGSDDRTAKLWDWAAGRQLGTLTGHEMPVRGVAFAPDGRTLATVAGSVKLWDPQTQLERASLQADTLRALCAVFPADGRRLLAGTYNGSVVIWEGATDEQLGAARPG